VRFKDSTQYLPLYQFTFYWLLSSVHRDQASVPAQVDKGKPEVKGDSWQEESVSTSRGSSKEKL
jgi:hypothetical protein